jgi:hypothetical protein
MVRDAANVDFLSEAPPVRGEATYVTKKERQENEGQD